MSRDNSLFIAKDALRCTLAEVANAVFSALGTSETEERFSSNYPPDDHYFVAYASNVVIQISDLEEDVGKENYPYLLSLQRVTYRKGQLSAPESATEVADILARAGFKVFRPIGEWWSREWDGSGVEHSPTVSS